MKSDGNRQQTAAPPANPIATGEISTARAERLAKLWDVRAFFVYIFTRFAHDQGMRAAASLSYTSLLALVPLAAISFAVLSGFSVFQGLRAEIYIFAYENLLPSAGENLTEAFDGFVEQAGSMTALGIIGLAVTAIILLATIEAAMNRIFRVARPRPLVMRVLVYWAILTLGPMLVGTSFTLSGYLMALGQEHGLTEHLTGLAGGLTRMVPAAIMMVTLFLFYLAVPNRPVRVRDALVGAVVGGLSFALLRWGFGLYIVYFPTYQKIYGALAAVPIFLVWMYLSWAVVLLGGVIVAALPEWRYGLDSARGKLTPGEELWVAVRVLGVLDRAARAGGAVRRRRMIEETAAADGDMERLLERLRVKDWVTRSDRGGWVLTRDPGSVTLGDLIRVLGLTLELEDDADAARGPAAIWRSNLGDRLAALAETRDEVMAITLRDLFDRGREEAQASSPA